MKRNSKSTNSKKPASNSNQRETNASANTSRCCSFCKNNMAPEHIYNTHILKDPQGVVVCPILRAYKCPLCGNEGGDKAHTLRYCPNNRPGALPSKVLTAEVTVATKLQPIGTPPKLKVFPETVEPLQSNPCNTYKRVFNRRTGPSSVRYCSFCKNNQEPESIYSSHVLKDPQGIVVCPRLRSYNCPICMNHGGDHAHTMRYCPKNRPPTSVVPPSLCIRRPEQIWSNGYSLNPDKWRQTIGKDQSNYKEIRSSFHQGEQQHNQHPIQQEQSARQTPANFDPFEFSANQLFSWPSTEQRGKLIAL